MKRNMTPPPASCARRAAHGVGIGACADESADAGCVSAARGFSGEVAALGAASAGVVRAASGIGASADESAAAGCVRAARGCSG